MATQQKILQKLLLRKGSQSRLWLAWTTLCVGTTLLLLGSMLTFAGLEAPGWEGWLVAVPLVALAGGVLVSVVAGGVAGLYPALRAARLSPTEALRS